MSGYKISRIVAISIAITIGAFISGCSHHENKENNTAIKISVSNAENLVKAAKEISGLTLTDSLGEHFPGDLSKVLYSGDSIIVLDTWKDPGVYVYDGEGMLVGAYAKRGNGPEEYDNILDMWVTPNTISLLVNFPNSQIITLDRNLNFVNKRDAEPQSQHFAMGYDGILFDRGNNAYGGSDEKLIYVSSSGKREEKLSIAPEIENLTFTSQNVFGGIDGDTVIYLPPLEPRLYFFAGGRGELACELDFGSAWPDFSVRTDRVNLMDVMQQIVSDGKIYSTNLIADGRNIAVTFFKDNDYYIVLMDKNEMSTPRVLRLPDEMHEGIGDLVAIRDGKLVFGTPGQLLTVLLNPVQE